VLFRSGNDKHRSGSTQAVQGIGKRAKDEELKI